MNLLTLNLINLERMAKKKVEKSPPKREPSPPKRRKCRHVFTLKDIDIELIETKYGIETSEIQPVNTTKLSEISTQNDNQIISFIDESKTEHLCSVSMIDFSTGKDISELSYCCYWDRHLFDKSIRPLGCPIRYVSNRVTKSYFSEISKEFRTITGGVTSQERNELDKRLASQVGFIQSANPTEKILNKKRYSYTVTKGEYYETDGIFCSFSCMKAFITENKNNPLYAHSNSLMVKMFCDITGLKHVVINPAPHWRQLISYGGDMEIEKFRSKCVKAVYNCHGLIKNESLFRPTAMLYEEKLYF